jgi:hypothetical protein
MNMNVHEDLQMNAVFREIKKWTTKYLKLENHTNILPVNLLDNGETTRRLKRYSILTGPNSTRDMSETPIYELK